MKIANTSYDHLTVESRPWFITGATWLLGLAALLGAFFEDDMGIAERLLVFALGVGVCAVAWRLMPFTSLDFDRTNGTLVVTHAHVTGAKQTEYALADIERTLVLIDNTDSAGLERLALKTTEGVKPIEFGYFNTPRKPVMAEINAWLEMEKEA